MKYLKNNATGVIGVFANLQKGWSPATDQEINNYLLTQAQAAKIIELETTLTAFMNAGYVYQGEIFYGDWSDIITYPCDAIIKASDGNNYRSLKDDNLNNDPPISPAFWKLFYPVFKTTGDAMSNYYVKDKMPAGPDKYLYYDKNKDIIDFRNFIGWSSFLAAILLEKDRIMFNKYNFYAAQIKECSTVAEVDAIVIEFSA